MKQTEKVLKYMQDFGSISTLEAFRDLGITRLSARIYDLQKTGVNVRRSMEVGKNRYKEPTHWTRYTLE